MLDRCVSLFVVVLDHQIKNVVGNILSSVGYLCRQFVREFPLSKFYMTICEHISRMIPSCINST